MERIIELQEEYFATDLDIGDHMLSWSEGEVVAYFESGGLSTPADTVSVAPSFSEVQSSADARTVRSMDDARDELLAEDEPADGAAHALGIDEEPALEDAMLDGLMASVPVTTRTLPSSDEACRQQQPPPAQPPPADPLAAYSVKELKEALRRAGVDASSFTEKSELVAAVARLPPDTGGAAAAAPPAAAAALLSEKRRRAVVKAQDIKKNADRCFGDRDYPKAELKYSKCIELLSAPEIASEADVAELRGALLSNRSACRAHLNRHGDALADGRAALAARPGWARAHSRIGFALFSLRRHAEAREAYEAGLAANPANADLQQGLASVLKELGSTAGASPAAAAAKQRGNAAFAAGDNEAALSAYTEAIALAPHDEALYSNRSAANARLGRWGAALEDGKRAISLRPSWGKAYSRAGLAALSGGDEEGAYWYFANGLRREPQSPELAKGREGALAALCSASTARHKRRLERAAMDASRPPARIFAVSDVHYDHPGAHEWGRSLSGELYRDDAIILAGDIGDTYDAVRLCLRQFRRCFRRVFYVPGNHDMWIRPKGQHSDEPARFADSVAKLLALWQLCDELNVDTGPAQLSTAAAVLPLESWYTHEFDHFDPRPGTVKFDKHCVWPMGYDGACRFMLRLNETKLAIPLRGDVITCSHFLPRQELPIPKMHEMAKGVGTVELDRQLRSAGSKLHIFGHTHINSIVEYDGVRYMQNALGYGIAPGQKLTVVHDKGLFREYLA